MAAAVEVPRARFLAVPVGGALGEGERMPPVFPIPATEFFATPALAALAAEVAGQL